MADSRGITADLGLERRGAGNAWAAVIAGEGRRRKGAGLKRRPLPGWSRVICYGSADLGKCKYILLYGIHSNDEGAGGRETLAGKDLGAGIELERGPIVGLAVDGGGVQEEELGGAKGGGGRLAFAEAGVEGVH